MSKTKWISTGSKSTWGDSSVRCYHSHPPLKIGAYEVYGGSCSAPVIKDADVYVGLDYAMAEHPQRFPWVPGEAIHFRITDGSAPRDVKNFLKLIDYLQAQIEAGKRVHIGCIGGHGRTGLVLAALVKQMTGEQDAVTYVRNHYCKRVVESQPQINFLHKHFGIKKTEPSKQWSKSNESFLKPKSGTGIKGEKAATPLEAAHSVFGSLKVTQT